MSLAKHVPSISSGLRASAEGFGIRNAADRTGVGHELLVLTYLSPALQFRLRGLFTKPPRATETVSANLLRVPRTIDTVIPDRREECRLKREGEDIENLAFYDKTLDI